MALDERPVQLLDSLRPGTPMAPAKVARRDYEYARCGTANIFCIVAPKGGRHHTHATPNRTAPRFAAALERIAKSYPAAETIHLVMDNLNTHCEKSLADHFGTERGRQLWARFTVHYTPKHGKLAQSCRTRGEPVVARVLGPQPRRQLCRATAADSHLERPRQWQPAPYRLAFHQRRCPPRVPLQTRHYAWVEALVAFLRPGRFSPYCHHFSASASRLRVIRIGFTFASMIAIRSGQRLASASVMSKKSMAYR